MNFSSLPQKNIITDQSQLTGIKGSSYMETGYIFAPYVPLILTPTIYAEEDLTPKKGIMRRYSKKLAKEDFYGLAPSHSISKKSI